MVPDYFSNTVASELRLNLWDHGTSSLFAWLVRAGACRCPGVAGAGPATADRKPLPMPAGIPGTGANHRLILKDGSYQSVRQYEVVGDRVRYLSQDRGEWEEMPADLVDWDATRKWERDHATGQEEPSPSMKEAEELDKEEAEERRSGARMPEVSKGLELPDADGVFVLDTYQGTPELVELLPSDLNMNQKDKHGLSTLNPLAGQKATIELDGAHAKMHLHVNDPEIYLSLDTGDAKRSTHALTVPTNGAKEVANRRHGAHSPASGFAIVHVDERQAVRIVGAIHISPTGTVTQNEDVIAAKSEVMPGKHWLKLTPSQAAHHRRIRAGGDPVGFGHESDGLGLPCRSSAWATIRDRSDQSSEAVGMRLDNRRLWSDFAPGNLQPPLLPLRARKDARTDFDEPGHHVEDRDTAPGFAFAQFGNPSRSGRSRCWSRRNPAPADPSSAPGPGSRGDRLRAACNHRRCAGQRECPR